MIAVKAHFDGKVIVPDEPVDLPKGQRLVVHIKVANALRDGRRAKKAKKPLRFKKEPGVSVLDWLEKNAVKDDSLPTDLAYNLDHYLYGAKKKPPLRKPKR